MFLFSLQATESFLEDSQAFMVGLFCKKCWQLKVVNYLGKKAPPLTFGWVPNMVLGNTVRKITNQKNVLQKKKKDWAFEVYLLTRESSQFLILVDWIIENDLCQILSVVLKFFVKLRGFGLFFCGRLSCPNSVK